MKYLFTLLLLVGCSSAMMSQNGYVDVEIGQPIGEVVTANGRPMRVYSKGRDSEVYEYVERITAGTRVIQQRRYFIVVSNNKVVGKYMKFDNPPPFDTIYSDDPFPNY